MAVVGPSAWPSLVSSAKILSYWKTYISLWNWSLGALWEPSNHEWRGSFENWFGVPPLFFCYHQRSEGGEKATWSPAKAAGSVASNCPPPSADVCSLQSFNGRFHGNLAANVLRILRNHANYLTAPAANGFKMTIRAEPFGVCHRTVYNEVWCELMKTRPPHSEAFVLLCDRLLREYLTFLEHQVCLALI